MGNGIYEKALVCSLAGSEAKLLCYTLQRKCWDDAEAEPGSHRVCSSFHFGTPHCVTNSLFNFPLHSFCKIPMRSSSCWCCYTHNKQDFPFSKLIPENSHSRRSELCDLTLGAKLTCMAFHLLSWKTNCGFFLVQMHGGHENKVTKLA